MQMTRLEEHPTSTGRLVAWVPTARCRAAIAAAHGTGRRGSYMQESHIDLRLAMEREHKHDASWIGTAFDMPADLDLAAFGRVFTTVARRHGMFHGWFTVTDDGYDWTELAEQDIEFEVVDLGTADTEQQVQQFVLDQLTERCTPIDGLGYQLCGVVGADRCVLYLGQDHIYTDGFSVIILFAELMQTWQAQQAGTTPDLLPVGHYLDYAEQERARAEAADHDHPAVQYWVDFALEAPDEMIPRFPLDIGLAPGQKTPLAPNRVDLLDADQDVALDRLAKDHECTFPSLVYAACALAAHELAGKPWFRFVNPVHTRTGDEWLTAMGWFINVVPVHCDVSDEDDLFTVGRRMRQALRDCRVAADLPALRVMEIISETLGLGFDSDSTQRPPIVSYLDGRILPGQEFWEEHRFFGLTGAGDHDDVNVWINRMPTQTYVMCAVPDTEQAQGAVTALFTRARDILLDALR